MSLLDRFTGKVVRIDTGDPNNCDKCVIRTDEYGGLWVDTVTDDTYHKDKQWHTVQVVWERGVFIPWSAIRRLTPIGDAGNVLETSPESDLAKDDLPF